MSDSFFDSVRPFAGAPSHRINKQQLDGGGSVGGRSRSVSRASARPDPAQVVEAVFDHVRAAVSPVFPLLL